MPLWPNARLDLFGRMPMRTSGSLAYTQSAPPTQRRLDIFVRENHARTSSYPEGYAPNGVLILPIRTGGMASALAGISYTGSGSLLSGGPMEGTAPVVFDQSGNLSLVVGLEGAATITANADGCILKLTIGLDGSASWALTGDANVLSLIVPFEGSGTVTLSGTANLKGLLSMAGESTPYTELSPENLANSVWNSLLEGSFTAKQLMRILAAVSAGKTDITDLGGGNATVVFRDLNDSKDRVTASMTGSERTTVTKDAS